MMTSDMTSDENGNFQRLSINNDDKQIAIGEIVKEISNRNSKINNTIDQDKKYNHKQTDNNFDKQNFFVIHNDRDLVEDAQMKISKFLS